MEYIPDIDINIGIESSTVLVGLNQDAFLVLRIAQNAPSAWVTAAGYPCIVLMIWWTRRLTWREFERRVEIQKVAYFMDDFQGKTSE